MYFQASIGGAGRFVKSRKLVHSDYPHLIICGKALAKGGKLGKISGLNVVKSGRQIGYVLSKVRHLPDIMSVRQ